MINNNTTVVVDEDDFEVSDNSLAEWWKIQDSGRILS